MGARLGHHDSRRPNPGRCARSGRSWRQPGGPAPACRTARVDLIYIDPPFNTGKTPDADRASRPSETRTATGRASRASATATDEGRQQQLRRHASTTTWRSSSRGSSRRTACSAPTGSLYFHIDYREVHYCKVLLDAIFGRECFLNEIIWAYDYGGRAEEALAAEARQHPRLREGPRATTSSTPTQIDRIPYMAPGLVGAGEGRARQAADRHLVAHDRPDQRRGEDRLPDPEAAGHPAADRAGVLAARATWCSTSSPAAARPARPP